MKLMLSVVLVALVGCGKKDGAKEEAKPTDMKPADPKPADPPPKPAASGRKLPNGNGHVVDAPAKWLDNGIGGAEGMHLDGEAGDFHIMEVTPDEAAKSMDDKKKEVEEVLFEKWVSAKKTAEGFEMIYVLDKMKMVGDDLKKDGTTFAFDVRRKIGDKLWTCSGAASTKDIADEAVGLCNKIAAE